MAWAAEHNGAAMTIIQALIFALIQGLTELFPVSSVAHGVLTPFLLGWNLDPAFLKEHFLPFVVMLHLGTAVALLLFFKDDWLGIARHLLRGKEKKTLLLIVVGTIPAGLAGLLFEKQLRHLFSNVTSAAIFLICNAALLYWGERIRKDGKKELTDLSYPQALLVGCFQSLALVPGFSRSGASIVAGLWMGLRHEAAAKFSMLLATPVIAGAAVLEVPKLARADMTGLFAASLVGGAAAGIAAFASVWALMRWFRMKEFNAMLPFAVYCLLLGLTVLLVNAA
jgi:undecaprenyl-diphosphatase